MEEKKKENEMAENSEVIEKTEIMIRRYCRNCKQVTEQSIVATRDSFCCEECNQEN